MHRTNSYKLSERQPLPQTIQDVKNAAREAREFIESNAGAVSKTRDEVRWFIEYCLKLEAGEQLNHVETFDSMLERAVKAIEA